jgi:hypothetical protein
MPRVTTKPKALANLFATIDKQPWGDNFSGTALSLPEKFEKIKLNGELVVDYLHLGSSEESNQGEVPKKNRVVFQEPFADEDFEAEDPNTGQQIMFKSARISMDLNGGDDAFENIDKDLALVSTNLVYLTYRLQ